MKVAEVAPLSGLAPSDVEPFDWFADAPEAELSRRSILKVVVGAGMGVAIHALGVFPPARRALADGYDIKGLPCPSYAVNHQCNPGCGPSATCSDCRTTIYNGWFKNDGVTYILRPNQCASGVWDGWLWEYQGNCGTCFGIRTLKCHDGYKKINGSWQPRIAYIQASCRTV